MGTELPHCQDSANPPASFKVFLGKASTKPGAGMAESVVATRLTLQVQGRLSFGGSHPPVRSQDSAHRGNSAAQASWSPQVPWFKEIQSPLLQEKPLLKEEKSLVMGVRSSPGFISSPHPAHIATLPQGSPDGGAGPFKRTLRLSRV